jgi:hypothetical protein
MITDDAEVISLLELSENEKIFGPIIFGYPKDYPERPPKRDPQVKWV